MFYKVFHLFLKCFPKFCNTITTKFGTSASLASLNQALPPNMPELEKIQFTSVFFSGELSSDEFLRKSAAAHKRIPHFGGGGALIKMHQFLDPAAPRVSFTRRANDKRGPVSATAHLYPGSANCRPHVCGIARNAAGPRA